MAEQEQTDSTLWTRARSAGEFFSERVYPSLLCYPYTMMAAMEVMNALLSVTNGREGIDDGNSGKPGLDSNRNYASPRTEPLPPSAPPQPTHARPIDPHGGVSEWFASLETTFVLDSPRLDT